MSSSRLISSISASVSSVTGFTASEARSMLYSLRAMSSPFTASTRISATFSFSQRSRMAASFTWPLSSVFCLARISMSCFVTPGVSPSGFHMTPSPVSTCPVISSTTSFSVACAEGCSFCVIGPSWAAEGACPCSACEAASSGRGTASPATLAVRLFASALMPCTPAWPPAPTPPAERNDAAPVLK